MECPRKQTFSAVATSHRELARSKQTNKQKLLPMQVSKQLCSPTFTRQLSWNPVGEGHKGRPSGWPAYGGGALAVNQKHLRIKTWKGVCSPGGWTNFHPLSDSAFIIHRWACVISCFQAAWGDKKGFWKWERYSFIWDTQRSPLRHHQ